MKTKLLTLFEKRASWKSVLLFFALQVLFSIVIMPTASGSDAHDLPILDLQFFYTPQQAYEIIGAYSPSMRQAAAVTRLTLDVVYPLIYGIMLAFLLTLTFRRAFAKHPLGDAAIFIPWSGVLFDYLENIGFAIMFLSYPKEYYFLAQVSAVFTALKWTLIGVAFVLALTGGVKLIFMKR
jgi:drug/metabolite transporter superfamily protein YnfA